MKKSRLAPVDVLLIILVILAAGFALFYKRIEIPQEETPREYALVFSHFWQNEEVKALLDKLSREFETQYANEHPSKNAEVEHQKPLKVVLKPYSYDFVVSSLAKPDTDEEDRKKKEFLDSDVLLLDSQILAASIKNGFLQELSQFNPAPEEPPTNPSDQSAAPQENTETQPSQENPVPPEEQKALEPVKATEQSWALPIISNIYVLFYNIDILQAQGFVKPPKSWNDFEKYATSFVGKGQYGLSFSLGADWAYPDIYSWIWAAGPVKSDPTVSGSFFKNGKPYIRDNALLINTLKRFCLFNYEEYLVPPTTLMPGTDPEWVNAPRSRQQKIDDFISQKAVMMIGSINDIENVRTRVSFNFGVSNIPVPNDFVGKPIFGLNNTYIGMGSQSVKQEAALAFINFLLNHSPELAAAVHLFPGNGSSPLTQSYNSQVPNEKNTTKAYDMFEGVNSEKREEFVDIVQAHRLNQIFCDEVAKMLDTSRQELKLNKKLFDKKWTDPNPNEQEKERRRNIRLIEQEKIISPIAENTAATIQSRWTAILSVE